MAPRAGMLFGVGHTSMDVRVTDARTRPVVTGSRSVTKCAVFGTIQTLAAPADSLMCRTSTSRAAEGTWSQGIQFTICRFSAVWDP